MMRSGFSVPAILDQFREAVPARAKLAKWARALFPVLVFAAAAWVIVRQLEEASLAQIGAAIASTPWWAIMISAAAAAVSYLCLAASDWWALTVIGKRIAAWRVVLVTFAAYAASNALGFSLATGGAVRLRFYGALGLSRAEVAAVTLLAGLAVSLSGIVAAGLALLATHGVSRWIIPVALLMLLPSALWWIPVPGKPPFLSHVALTTPPVRGRALAFSGALLDWLFSGLALFVLLPHAAPEHFAPFLAVFIMGSVVSAASGVPGGLGVFEAVVLMLSREFALGAETAAALLLYRLIYAVGPFALVALAGAARALRR